MKIKNYNNFILEWGYGGEGGVASKDPIKVKDSMIDEIEIDEGETDEDKRKKVKKDIPILKDLSEQYKEIDPYNEENWDEILPEYSYSEWLKVNKGKNIYFYLKQLKMPHIDYLLKELS